MVVKQRNFKMEWAQVHLDALQAEIARVKGKPYDIYRITMDEDIEHGLLHIRTETVQAIAALRAGLIAGDFICNLRASLDHIIWAMASAGGRHPSNEICFPICAKDCPRTQAKIGAATAGIPPEAIARVKSFQPYHAGKAYKSAHLWRLNFLWNLDKHRNIALHSMDSGILFSVAKGIPVQEFKFDDSAIVTIPLAAKNKVHLNPRPDLVIAFGDENRGVKVFLEDLRDIYEFVSTKVFPAFAGFIP